MHIGPTPPTASPLLTPYPLDFSNPIPSNPHDSHNAIDIFPSHHHSLPDALTSLNAGPVEGLLLAPMDSVQLPAARVAHSVTAAANKIISALATTQGFFLVHNNPITFVDDLPLLKPLLSS